MNMSSNQYDNNGNNVPAAVPYFVYGCTSSSSSSSSSSPASLDDAGCIEVYGPDKFGVLLVFISWPTKKNALNLTMLKTLADLFRSVSGTASPSSSSTDFQRNEEMMMMIERYAPRRVYSSSSSSSQSSSFRVSCVVLSGGINPKTNSNTDFCAGVDLAAAQGVFQGDIGNDGHDNDSPFQQIDKYVCMTSDRMIITSTIHICIWF